MNGKIFNAIWSVAIAVFLASLLFIMGGLYDYFSEVQEDQLKAETQMVSQGVVLSGMDYLNRLETKNYRVTWIRADGTVLYDTAANSGDLENHLERDEVKLALAEGYGKSMRFSNTLSDKQLYSAMRLPDGSVLRLSVLQKTVWTMLFGFAQPVCIVVFIAFILSFILASRLTRRILEPINSIDPDRPMQHFKEAEYKEIAPLLKRLHEQQEQMKCDRKEIEKAALIRQDFTANVSHELKTPLHVISGYAELLETGLAKDEDIKPFAAKIRAEAGRMTSLVEDIIELTELDNGGSELVWETCDLYRISKNALDSLETVAADRNIHLELHGESSHLQGVSKLLHSIVYNLCDNAIKYNRENGKVLVQVENERESVMLHVRDTGIGIPEDCRERIFERFYRVDKSRSKEAGGTGLGLSIVKHAVMIHKGMVKVSGEAGEGTEFIVSLPKNIRKN